MGLTKQLLDERTQDWELEQHWLEQERAYYEHLNTNENEKS